LLTQRFTAFLNGCRKGIKVRNTIKDNDNRLNYWRLAVLIALALGAVAGLPDFLHGLHDGFTGV